MDATATTCSRTDLSSARAAAARLADLLSTEHGAMADFLLALAAFDAARGWAELGHANLFAFLHRDLGLSRSAAFQRKVAAGLLQRFPAVEAPLRDGRICLSSLYELSQVVTEANAAQLLPRFFRLSAREARAVVAELVPNPDPPRREVVTQVPARKAATGAPPPEVAERTQGVLTSERPGEASARDEGGSGGVSVEPPALIAPATLEPAPLPVSAHRPMARPPDTSDPLSGEQSRLHVTVSRRFLRKLEAAKGARAHARPGASTEAILEEALDLLLAREAKRRTAATVRPRRAPGVGPEADRGQPARARREPIPASVRREVWARDQGRCQWPLEGGGVCASTHRLELDHVLPVARGGGSTVANLRTLCEAHNHEAARRTFGETWWVRERSRWLERSA